jgi:hypothetical protein
MKRSGCFNAISSTRRVIFVRIALAKAVPDTTDG